MKQILFLLFFASILQAQSTTKTYELGSDGVNFFELTTVTKDDESAVTTKVRVGPASELAADQSDKIEAVTKELSAQAFATLRTGTRIAEFNKIDTTITDISAVSPLRVILDRYRAELTKAGWTIDEGSGAGFVPIVFTVNAQNKLRFSINGAATKSATIYGDFIKLSSYPTTGKSEIFYLHPKGDRYFSLNGLALKKP